MGAKTPKKVDFERLVNALSGYHNAYLITVDDDYRVHAADLPRIDATAGAQTQRRANHIGAHEAQMALKQPVGQQI